MIYPHTVEEHSENLEDQRTRRLAFLCEECGFCQCEELEGLHGLNCGYYDYSVEEPE